MMRNIILLGLIAMTFSLVGCKKDKKNNDDDARFTESRKQFATVNQKPAKDVGY